MPTGVRTWASDLGLPVSLEAAIREQRSDVDDEGTIERIIKFYKTNSAKKKAEFDNRFLDLLIYGEANDEDKEDVNTNIGALIDDVIIYVNAGPDLPNTFIEAIRMYADPKEVQSLITYWGSLEPSIRADISAKHVVTLTDPSAHKTEKEYNMKNSILTFKKLIGEYFAEPTIKLLRNVLQETNRELVTEVERFFNVRVNPKTKKMYNDLVQKSAELPDGVQKDNEFLTHIINLLKFYSKHTPDATVDFVIADLNKRIKPAEGQPRTAAQAEADLRLESKTDEQIRASQNLAVVTQQLVQQTVGTSSATLSNPQGLLLSPQGEASISPFGKLTNPEAKQVIKQMIPLNRSAQATIDATNALLRKLYTMLPKDIVVRGNEKATSEGKKEFITYDLQLFLAKKIYDKLGIEMPEAEKLNKWAIKRGYSDLKSLYEFVEGKLAENEKILEAYQGKQKATDDDKSFLTRLDALKIAYDAIQASKSKQEKSALASPRSPTVKVPKGKK